MASILDNIGELWHRTGLVQRALLGGVLLACLAAGGFLAFWASRPSYSLLYSGLTAAEAAKIVEKAQDDDIPCKLKDGGTTIYISNEHVHRFRLKLAGEGLPEGGHKGYRILENQQIGINPILQDAHLKQALEGELAKTIEAMAAVTSARVLVVPAQSGLLGGNRRQAKASVAIKLKHGAHMTAGNVAAIVHMVAGGVEGLSPGDVEVVDNDLNLLTDKGGDEASRTARGVLNHKVQTEQYLARKAERMLAAVLGPGRATVQVAVTIDTISLEETVETPSDGATMSETITKRTSKPVSAGGSASGQDTVENTTETRYSDPGRTTRRTTTPPGKVTSKSVSCFVDLSAPAQAEGEESAPPAPAVTVSDVELMIQNALGLDINRDAQGAIVADATSTDSLKVVDTKFHREASALAAAGVADEGMFTKGFILDLARRGSLGVLVVGVLLALKMVSKGRGAAAATGGTIAIEGAGGASGALPATAGAAAGPAGRQALRSQITRALQDNPDEVKRLFLSWAENEQGGA